MIFSVCPMFTSEDMPSGRYLTMVINGNDDAAFTWGCSCGSRAQLVAAQQLGCWDHVHHGCVRFDYLKTRIERDAAVLIQGLMVLNPPALPAYRRMLDGL